MAATRLTARFIALTIVAVGMMLASGCDTIAPEEPDLIGDRLRPGSGLLSGATGEFVLFPPSPETPKPKDE